MKKRRRRKKNKKNLNFPLQCLLWKDTHRIPETSFPTKAEKESNLC
jgi:hypothetical protein